MALHIWDSLTLHSVFSLRRKKNRPQKEKIWTRRVLCWGDWGRVWLLVGTSDFYVGLREHGHEVGVSWGGQYTWGGPCLDGRTMLNFRSQTQSFIAKTPSLGSSFHNDNVLGKGSNNQNGNLRWHLPLGVRPPPPLNGKISRHFFTPLFFFCNWILHIWNGFYTSKISLLSWGE